MLHFSMATREDGSKSIAVFANGRLTTPIDDSHPNFKAIVGACQASMQGEDVDEAKVLDLFDIPATIERKFARLSERVTVANGEVLFDGDPCQPGLSAQILRFMDEDEDFEPLVKFMENVMTNPQDESREQLWTWLNGHDFTINENGEVIIYKGVYGDGSGGYRSGWAGSAMVNDVQHNNVHIPYAVGDVVTMPRSEVMHDPHAACHRGLHVGTFNYAKYYASGAMLRCIVNPRDVVSVPYDAQGEKIRVCRFVIDSIIDSPETSALYRAPREEPADLAFEDEPTFKVGDRVEDIDGDVGMVIDVGSDNTAMVEYDGNEYDPIEWDAEDLKAI